jgi:hypothetical protein
MGNTWLSVGEAAARAHLSYNAMLRLLMLGEVEGTRRGLRWWIERASVDRLTRRLRDVVPLPTRKRVQRKVTTP